MKKALPFTKTNEFLSSLKSQAGKIRTHEFLKYEKGTYASYKTTFEKGIFILNISINDRSKINGLFLKPFIEKIASKTIINNLSIKNNIITDKQSKIIFENSKSFPKETQIALAIIKNGKVRYYGLTIMKDTLVYIENHKSIFEIGSITKVFTSTLLSGFVIDKKIKLNDNINDYLNLSLNNNTVITFKELSNHTSGLPRLPPNLDLTKVDPSNPYKIYNKDDLEDYLTKSLELPQNRIGKYQYSNLGAGIIGHILSKIDRMSFDSLLQNRIFSKYNMIHSTTSLNKVKNSLVKGLDAKGNIVPNWEFSVLSGAGGI